MREEHGPVRIVYLHGWTLLRWRNKHGVGHYVNAFFRNKKGPRNFNDLTKFEKTMSIKEVKK